MTKQRLFVLFLIASILLPWTVQADSIGPRNGQSVHTDINDPSPQFSDLHTIKNGDGLYAQAMNLGFEAAETAEVVISKFEFNVPANSKIDGVVVEVNRRGIGPGAVGTLSLAGALSDPKQSVVWGNVFLYETFGSPTDTWGATLTPAIVNSNSFGASIIVTLPGYQDSTGTIGARIEHIRMTVYYSIQAGMPPRSITISQGRDHLQQKKAA